MTQPADPLREALDAHMPIEGYEYLWCQCGWKADRANFPLPVPPNAWADHREAAVRAALTADHATLRSALADELNGLDRVLEATHSEEPHRDHCDLCRQINRVWKAWQPLTAALTADHATLGYVKADAATPEAALHAALTEPR